MPLPRLDAHPEHHVRAWLHPNEAKILDALVCDDLSCSVTISVLLTEHRDEHGRRKKGTSNRHKLTDAQRARETIAGRFIGAYQQGTFMGAQALDMIAHLRRELHYANLGQEPPEVPSEPTDSQASEAPDV